MKESEKAKRHRYQLIVRDRGPAVRGGKKQAFLFEYNTDTPEQMRTFFAMCQSDLDSRFAPPTGVTNDG